MGAAMSAIGDGRTRPGWFDNRLSIGNIITIATLIIAIVAGWFQFEKRLTLVEAEQRRVAITMERVEKERGDLHTRVIRIEERLTGQADMLQRILRNTESDHWRRREP